MPTWKPSRTSDPRSGLRNPRLHTLDPRRERVVFMVWTVGHRAPRSFHTSEADARETARESVRPGQSICVLRAEIVATAEAAEPIVTFHGAPAIEPFRAA